MVYELDWFLDLIFVIFVFLDYLSNLKYGASITFVMVSTCSIMP